MGATEEMEAEMEMEMKSKSEENKKTKQKKNGRAGRSRLVANGSCCNGASVLNAKGVRFMPLPAELPGTGPRECSVHDLKLSATEQPDSSPGVTSQVGRAQICAGATAGRGAGDDQLYLHSGLADWLGPPGL